MLLVTSDGRKAALDLRLARTAIARPSRQQGESGGRSGTHLARHGGQRSTQLVFCDLSVRPTRAKGFSVYEDMRDKLKVGGIPEREIAFIRTTIQATRPSWRCSAMCAGKVRVLFGSTQKMGTGTNVQERLIALHHLDAPWRPADVEQREGRILRQGNKNSEVQIYRYVTEGIVRRLHVADVGDESASSSPK
jgi:hypothetical protein